VGTGDQKETIVKKSMFFLKPVILNIIKWDNPKAPYICSTNISIIRWAEDAPADVAFDLLGYEASVQEAITTPWAKSFAMEITCSDSAMTKVKRRF